MSTVSANLERLRAIVAQLRDPDGGCPWDLEQTHRTLAPYLLEETYELLEALEQAQDGAMREELGDVLLQVVFHAQLASERGVFGLAEVVDDIADKMVRRHPHVFGDRTVGGAPEVQAAWERAKQNAGKRVLDGVPAALPSLLRAHRLTAKAATVGFDWPDATAVFDKVDEELGELREAVTSGNLDSIEDEMGDMLFVLANLARKLDVQPEIALRRTLTKFERRFRYVEESLLGHGRHPRDATLAEMDALWNEAKGKV